MDALALGPQRSGGVVAAPPARVPTLVQVLLFLGITFAVTWACFLPFVLGRLHWGAGEGQLLRVLAIGAPSLTAFVLTALAAGRAGVRGLWRQGTRWRVGPGWYAFVLLGPGLAIGAGLAVTAALRGQVAPVSLSIEVVLAAVISGLLAGALEEFGWSGFAFPGLQARFGLFAAGAMVGAFLAVWHLPLFFIPGLPHAAGSFPLFLAAGIPLRIVFGWIYIGTGGSILLMILFHGALNAWADILSLPTAQAEPTWLVFTVLLWMAVVILLRTERGVTPRPPSA
jgi:uncharacterized protein